MGKAIITITIELLEELLGIPKNVSIYAVLSENQMLKSEETLQTFDSDNILIKLHGDNLPECPEGGRIERISIDELKERGK